MVLNEQQVRLVATVGAALRELRYIDEGFGLEQLRPDSVLALREAFGVGIERRNMSAPCEDLPPREGEVARCAIRARLPLPADLFLQVEAVGQRIFAGTELPRTAAQLFAVALVFNDHAVREMGERWALRAATALHQVEPSPHWMVRHLPVFMALRPMVLAEVEAAAPFDILSMARDLSATARACGDYCAAERWLGVKLGVARARGDRAAECQALLYLGRIGWQVGRRPNALRHLHAALRLARAGWFAWELGAVHQSFAAVAIDAMKHRAVRKHALAALASYPPGHPDTVRLAQDVAAYWLRRGLFVEALPVLLSISCCEWSDPAHEWIVHCNTALAAAWCGCLAEYKHATQRAFAAYVRIESFERVAHAKLTLAEACFLAGDTRKAHGLAEEAVHLASQRGEGGVVTEGQDLLKRIAAASGGLRRRVERVWNADSELASGFVTALAKAA